MTGLVIGTVLGVVALAWVLAPIGRAKRGHRAVRPSPAGDASLVTAVVPGVDDDAATAVAATLDDAAERAIRRWREREVACPDCGGRPERDALFCSNCGRFLADACGRCGAKVSDRRARYCIECGETLAG